MEWEDATEMGTVCMKYERIGFMPLREHSIIVRT